ncbi:Chromo domain/shadow [Plasmopara halstedii]|uniref:Chromo domain/shadow n=1 Tax=Plasmopara halstedii TaxID=4781 RepID=A0A0P1APN0_PLAHL|nr:Chromo domain/shadow [Plasmopara halstedii]CEG43453.1 Chromo domain/shadow [Plasmopara halstedii]|eukprot:XP_024579822.1 Chromo domain/shadow [Plasmopara halstedii]
MLDTRGVSFNHAAKDMENKRAKFAARKVGPFEIIKMINPIVAKPRSSLSMKKNNQTFSVDVLLKYEPTPDKFFSRRIPKASKFVNNYSADQLQIIRRLLKKRQFNRQPEWLVQWHGETEEEASWEKEKDIRHIAHWNNLVVDFKQRQQKLKSVRM